MPAVTNAASIAVGDPVPQKFKEWFINDRDHLDKWRQEAKEDYEFVAGRQYSDKELDALAKKKRPVVVFNRIQPVVDSVHGQEIGNRREVRYIPRELGDAKANEMLTGAAQWFRDQAHAETHESDSFWDTIVCGLGWTETRIDYEERPDGKPIIDRVDPFEMYYDFNARGRNLTDKRRVERVRRIPLSEAMEMFPGFDRAQLDAAWTTVTDTADLTRNALTEEGSDASGDGMVTVVHMQWIERESFYIAYDPVEGVEKEFTTEQFEARKAELGKMVSAIDPTTRQEAIFSQEEFDLANDRLTKLLGTGMMGRPLTMEGARMRRKVRKQAFFGNVVLAYGPAPCPTKFSFQAITGKRDRNTNTWYGLVRSMKDPQRWANKWLSQTMHIMNANAKGGLLAEKGAFENQRDAEASWADPSAITWVKNGALSGTSPTIKEKAPAQFPAGFMQLTQFAISSIRDTSGVSVEMLGLREAGQAASLEMQRRQAGMTILQPFFDALKFYREMQGEVMLYYIQHDLSDGRLIKISGPENEQYVPLIKQASSEYDIIVDDAPTSPNMKEAAWAIMMQLLPAFGSVMPPEMLMTMLEYSPLPSTIVDKLKKQAEEMQASQQEQQQKMAAAAEAQQGAEIEKTQSETAKNQATAQKAATDAQVSAGKFQMEKDLSGYSFAEGMKQGLEQGLTTQGLM